jgi:hypothetical protein
MSFEQAGDQLAEGLVVHVTDSPQGRLPGSFILFRRRAAVIFPRPPKKNERNHGILKEKPA